MPDPQMASTHLEGLPRRDSFRAARDRVRVACGELTLGADADPLLGTPPDGATLDVPACGFSYWLRDGDASYPLAVGVNSIGRLPDNSVCVRDECVSRRHCAVVIHRDGRCEVHDVASKNGTVVNGHRIAGPTRLRPGDQLTLCARRLTFLAGPPERESGERGR